jgi:hypothetical protein
MIVESGEFQILPSHEVLHEIYDLIIGLAVTNEVVSDHYTNYIHVAGTLPPEREYIF